MKRVIYGKEFQEALKEAIILLGETTATTLGPSGHNVLINSKEQNPYITNDGVTIAQTIESENPIKNGILEILKEASLKTNEEVGDGTTTTIVLLKSILLQGLEKIETISGIQLQKELKETMNNILIQLD